MKIKISKEVCLNCHSIDGCYDGERLDFEKDWDRNYIFCKDIKRVGYVYRTHENAIKKCSKILEHLIVGQKMEINE